MSGKRCQPGTGQFDFGGPGYTGCLRQPRRRRAAAGRGQLPGSERASLFACRFHNLRFIYVIRLVTLVKSDMSINVANPCLRFGAELMLEVWCLFSLEFRSLLPIARPFQGLRPAFAPM